MTIRYFHRDGTPAAGYARSDNPDDSDYFRVAHDNEGGLRVSTVFLSMDHSLTDSGTPLIFESMVFPADSWHEIDMRRYATEAQALAGHAELVREYLGREPAN